MKAAHGKRRPGQPRLCPLHAAAMTFIIVAAPVLTLVVAGCRPAEDRRSSHPAPFPEPSPTAVRSAPPGFVVGTPSPAMRLRSPAGLDAAADVDVDVGVGDGPQVLPTGAGAEQASHQPATTGTPLQPEAQDPDARSKLVMVRVLVEPAAHARVFWGSKDLGAAPLDIQRPRASGPLDLMVRSPGFLTFHTRLFTDRDDRVAIRLVPQTEASSVFGYRPANSR